MKKICVLLSDNLILACELRDIAKTFDIELTSCKSIFEMLEKYNKGTNAIIIENVEKYGNLQENISEVILKKVYYVKNGVVADHNNKTEFKTYKDFFESDVFKHLIYQKTQSNYEDNVNKKLNELDIVMNSWKARFIKYILCEMRSRGERRVSRDIIETVGASKEVECKHIYDSLRPLLKQYIFKLSQKTNKTYNNKKVKEMINSLYNFVFS